MFGDYSRPPGYTSDDVEWINPVDGRNNDEDADNEDTGSEDTEASGNKASLSNSRRKRQKTQ